MQVLPIYSRKSISYRAPVSRRALGLALPLSLLMSTSALALTPSEAWDSYGNILSSFGMDVLSSESAPEGDALVVRNLVLRLPFGMAEGNISISELRLTPEGAASVRMSTPGEMSATITQNFAGMPSTESTYIIRQEGSALLTQDGDQLSMAMDYPTTRITQTMGDAPDMDMSSETVITGLVGQASHQLVAPFAFESRATAAAVNQSANFSSTEGIVVTQSSTGNSTGIEVSFSGRNLPHPATGGAELIAAIRKGLEIESTMRMTQSTVTSQNDFSGDSFTLTLNQAPSEAQITLSGGQFTITGTSEPITGEISSASVNGPFSFGASEFHAAVPLVVTPDDRDIALRLNLSDITLGEGILRNAGLQMFANETINFNMNIAGRGRLQTELDDPEFANANVPPFAISAFPQLSHRLSIGSVSSEGSGSLTFGPDFFTTMGSPNHQDDVTGNYTIDLRGMNAMLTRLVEAGLLPAEQQFAIQMGINGFGRPVGDDHLRAEIQVRPGSQVTVNGMPLPF